jgi:hypothetical protein
MVFKGAVVGRPHVGLETALLASGVSFENAEALVLWYMKVLVERVIVVEVLDRRGRVRERVRLDRLPAFVGRAYMNDVVLEDRFVSPRHCAIREAESGEMVLEDLESLNGVKVLTDSSPGSLTLRSDRFVS